MILVITKIHNKEKTYCIGNQEIHSTHPDNWTTDINKAYKYDDTLRVSRILEYLHQYSSYVYNSEIINEQQPDTNTTSA